MPDIISVGSRSVVREGGGFIPQPEGLSPSQFALAKRAGEGDRRITVADLDARNFNQRLAVTDQTLNQALGVARLREGSRQFDANLELQQEAQRIRQAETFVQETRLNRALELEIARNLIDEQKVAFNQRQAEVQNEQSNRRLDLAADQVGLRERELAGREELIQQERRQREEQAQISVQREAAQRATFVDLQNNVIRQLPDSPAKQSLQGMSFEAFRMFPEVFEKALQGEVVPPSNVKAMNTVASEFELEQAEALVKQDDNLVNRQNFNTVATKSSLKKYLGAMRIQSIFQMDRAAKDLLGLHTETVVRDEFVRPIAKAWELTAATITQDGSKVEFDETILTNVLNQISSGTIGGRIAQPNAFLSKEENDELMEKFRTLANQRIPAGSGFDGPAFRPPTPEEMRSNAMFIIQEYADNRVRAPFVGEGGFNEFMFIEWLTRRAEEEAQRLGISTQPL